MRVRPTGTGRRQHRAPVLMCYEQLSGQSIALSQIDSQPPPFPVSCHVVCTLCPPYCSDGKVPVLVHDGLELVESAVVAEYAAGGCSVPWWRGLCRSVIDIVECNDDAEACRWVHASGQLL